MIDPHYKGMPKSVKIGNLIYEVRKLEKDTSDASGYMGMTDPINQFIIISEGQKPTTLADTFIHEVLHAICYGMELSSATEGRNTYKDVEEMFVRSLAHGICQFWQDNPQAVRWWAKTNNILPTEDEE